MVCVIGDAFGRAAIDARLTRICLWLNASKPETNLKKKLSVTLLSAMQVEEEKEKNNSAMIDMKHIRMCVWIVNAGKTAFE